MEARVYWSPILILLGCLVLLGCSTSNPGDRAARLILAEEISQLQRADMIVSLAFTNSRPSWRNDLMQRFPEASPEQLETILDETEKFFAPARAAMVEDYRNQMADRLPVSVLEDVAEFFRSEPGQKYVSAQIASYTAMSDPLAPAPTFEDLVSGPEFSEDEREVVLAFLFQSRSGRAFRRFERDVGEGLIDLYDPTTSEQTEQFYWWVISYVGVDG